MKDSSVLKRGALVGERYKLEREIGSGAMGVVWRATHVGMKRPVAVKFLMQSGLGAKQRRERFEREARIVGSLRHRNVVDILDVGEANGVPYMVLELLDGESLADRLKRRPPVTVDEAVRIASLTLSGLAAVHAVDVVHRDVKPANIFLVRDEDGDFPKLLDFGVSKTLDGEPAGRGAAVTQDGALLGTPHYMSPEQVRGLRDVDRRTDVFSLGVVLYEMLTGKKPFDAGNIAEIMIAVTTRDVPAAHTVRPEVGARLGAIVARAMARDPAERFQSAAEMRAALADVAGAPATKGATASASLRPRPRPGEGVIRKSRRALTWSLIALAIGGLGIAGYVLFPDAASSLLARTRAALSSEPDATTPTDTPRTISGAAGARPRPVRRPPRRRPPPR